MHQVLGETTTDPNSTAQEVTSSPTCHEDMDPAAPSLPSLGQAQDKSQRQEVTLSQSVPSMRSPSVTNIEEILSTIDQLMAKLQQLRDGQQCPIPQVTTEYVIRQGRVGGAVGGEGRVGGAVGGKVIPETHGKGGVQRSMERPRSATPGSPAVCRSCCAGGAGRSRWRQPHPLSCGSVIGQAGQCPRRGGGGGGPQSGKWPPHGRTAPPPSLLDPGRRWAWLGNEREVELDWEEMGVAWQ
ncbi:hypothetical protein JZ751_007468 [Albula glossodonta]|uniref:Uncharacterized protein n=1 Tax=Albula glossodonta TaxID=121402 RepID=A0A8T2MUS3_9TELE|nr:hypothetical protein JZ751_007468 [Albula glossodonta]